MKSQDSLTFIAMIFFSLLGNTAMAAQPMLVGGFVDLLGLTERQAGFVSGAELGGLALGMCVLLPFVTRLDRRVLAVVAVAIIVAANVLSIQITRIEFLSRIEYLLPVRAMSGMGAATAYAVFLTIAAASARPERSFGAANAVSIMGTGILVWLAPTILDSWQLAGIFLTLIGIALVVLLTAGGVPRSTVVATTVIRTSSAEADSKLFRSRWLELSFVVSAMFLLYAGHAGIWTYQERIGVGMGIPQKEVGFLIGTSMLIWGMLGSLLATFLGLRLGRVWPQVLSLGVSVIAALMLVLVNSAAGFGVACALIALSWFFGLPYQMGLLADIDPQGRANVLGSLMTTFGAAVGPIGAAVLIGLYNSYVNIAVMAGLFYFLALMFVLPVAARWTTARSASESVPIVSKHYEPLGRQL